MLISQIEVLDKLRRRILIEGEESFWLYKKDVEEYGLYEQQIISDQQYKMIRTEKVLLYAKKKALELLERMDRSEAELRTKLRQRDFSDSVIDEAVAYAKRFHYVDDVRFAMHFIHTRSSSKSKKQIFFSLYQKGVSKEDVETAYEEFIHEQEQQGYEEEAKEVESPEILAIKKIVNRKGKPISDYTKEELLKLTATLYRKGFSASNIRQVLSYDPDFL